MNVEKNIEGNKKYWQRLYIIVIVFLILQIVLYQFITEYFTG